MRIAATLFVTLLSFPLHGGAPNDAPATQLLQPGKLLVSEDLNQPFGKEWFGAKGKWDVVDGVMRGAAELRQLGNHSPGQAEAAISVEKPWQSHGVGSGLLRRTLLAARNRGFRHLHMACLADNRRMQQLARKFAAELSFDFGSVVGEVESMRANPLSVMQELIADHHGFATAILDLQSRMLRA